MILTAQQQEAIQKLEKYKVGALFMEMGTGKTLTAFHLINSALSRGKCDTVVWLTPYQNKANIRQEISLYSGLSNLHIIGIESLQNSDSIFLHLTQIVEENKVFLIVDESIKIKNFQAKRTQRILQLSKKCEYKLLLNGTPITRNLLDMWSQMEFLSPKILNMGYYQFMQTFCEITKITKVANNAKNVREYISGYANVPYLYSLIEKYVFECTLKISIQQQHSGILYDISQTEREEYEKLKAYYLSNENLERMNNRIFLQMTQKMQHSYCLCADKLAKLDSILNELDCSRVVIFTKFVKTKLFLEDKYKNIKVLSYGKHAYGLNLQQYNVTIFYEKTYDYSQLIQGEFRTYRMGQDSDCRYIHFTGKIGLEDLIDDNISKKITLSEYFKQVGIEYIKQKL